MKMKNKIQEKEKIKTESPVNDLDIVVICFSIVQEKGKEKD